MEEIITKMVQDREQWSDANILREYGIEISVAKEKRTNGPINELTLEALNIIMKKRNIKP